MVPGWNIDATPKEFLLSLTIGCIGATLFIKALTIKNLVRYFKLDSLTEVEEVEYQEARALMHYKVTHQLERYVERGYIDAKIADILLDEHNSAFTTACEKVCALSEEYRNDLAFRVLRIYAIGIERRSLKSLFEHNEVNETVFRRIWGKLQIQLEAIEHGDLSPDVTLHEDGRDVFEHLASYIQRVAKPKSDQQNTTDRFMYYRAQVIISRKVIKELSETKKAKTIFTDEAVQHVLDLYATFKDSAQTKLNTLASEHPKWSGALAEKLAQHSVQTIEQTVLRDIYRKELVTPKLFIALTEEIEKVK